MSDDSRQALRCNFCIEKWVLHVKRDDMTKFVLLLVGSVVAFSLSGCVDNTFDTGNATPAPYIAPQSTESHMPGAQGPNTSIPGMGR